MSFDNNVKGQLFVGGDGNALKEVEEAELEVPLELEDDSAQGQLDRPTRAKSLGAWRIAAERSAGLQSENVW